MAAHNTKMRDYIKEIETESLAKLDCYHIKPGFPDSVENLKTESFITEYLPYRQDYSLERAFTIDSENCKDMDDAVSICKNPYGYRIGIHIADVSAFVTPGSELDSIAVNRSNSIYLPVVTVPMLPGVLSNNLCSLNPGVLRPTLSVIIHLNYRGELVNFEIAKGEIISRVKGVYAEVNRILNNTADENVKAKYAEVYDDIFDMYDVFKMLRHSRIIRGSHSEETAKPKISINEHEIVLTPDVKGPAENIIEEFMILANSLVSNYLNLNNLPAIYRVQYDKEDMAEYRAKKSHHADLALESYSHFTAPIRRISDLKIHQILSLFLSGKTADDIHRIFDDSMDEICDIATRGRRTAKSIVNACEKYCYKLFFEINSSKYFKGSCIGYDRANRPIVKIDKYNIKVIGLTILGAEIGEKYSFRVDYSESKKVLFTRLPKRLYA